MVIAAANTGNESNNKNAVMNTLQTNNGIRCIDIPGALILSTVVIKLMAPKIELRPER